MQPANVAEPRIRAALKLAPHSAALHDELGTVLARQGRHAEAIAPLARALELDPTLPHTRKRLADALAASGRGPEADRLYKEYFAQDADRQQIADGAEHLKQGAGSRQSPHLRTCCAELQITSTPCECWPLRWAAKRATWKTPRRCCGA